jgi:hypothetical protein
LLNSIQQQQSSISGYTAAGEAASSITSYLHSATTTNAQTSISDASCIGPLLVQQQQQQRQRHIFLDHQQQQQQQQVRALERFSSSSLSSVVQNHLLTQTHQIQQPQHGYYFDTLMVNIII